MPTAAVLSPLSPVIPSPETMAFATRLLRDIGRFVLLDTDTGKQTKLDETVFRLMQRLLADLAAGHAVSIIPFHHELSTFEAADLLNVSRPHLIKLLEAGDIPFHLTGTHRRIRMQDLLAYKGQRDAVTDKALAELTRLSQQHGEY